MHVVVDRPDVRGSRVRFSWSQDVPSSVQRTDHWSVRYHGVPVRRVLRSTGRGLLYDVLLSVQLPLWRKDARDLRITLPEHVDEARLAFWRAYHDAEDVVFDVPPAPAAGATGTKPPPAPVAAPELPRVAVTFGGGKDSTLALEVLRLTREPSQVLLLHAVHPRVPGRRAAARALWRSVRHVVAPPVLRHRVPVQLVTTDHMSSRTPAAPGPHVNLYAPMMLPALIHRRVASVVFSNSVMGYRATRQADGTLRFSNPTGRPERLEHLHDYLEHELGWGVHVECTHRAIVEYLSYGVLRERFPEAFEHIVMCPRYRARGRFCADCSKCLEFAVFGLSLGYAAPDLDYSRLFTSERVERITGIAREVADQTAVHGNSPYQRAIGTATHFAGWCHALSKIDPDHLPVALSEQASANLRTIVSAWGRQPFWAVQAVDPEAVAACGPFGREVADVVAGSALVAEAPASDGVLLVGDVPAEFDHSARMPTPALDAWAERWIGR